MRNFAHKVQGLITSSFARSNMAMHGVDHRANPRLHLRRRIDAEEFEAGLTSTAESRFEHDLSRIPTHSPAVGAIPAKLAINQPGDEYEQEAERVADQVMATTGHPAGSGTPPRIQRFSGQSNEPMEMVPASVARALASTGRPLEPALRQDMEQRFGYDFSRVRVHSGAAAEQSAQDVNAHAYTIGHDVVLGAGQFAPGMHEGRRLIAHELTHVVQQQKGVQASVQRAPKVGGPSPGPKIGGVEVEAVDVRSTDPNCEYQKGEVARSHTSKGILDYDIEKAEFFGIEPADAVVVADFKVGDGNLRPSTESDFRKYWMPTFDQGSMSSLEIVGFSDCVGWESHNEPLREQRARVMGRLLPGLPTRAAPFDDYLVANTSERGRALNRAVIIKHKPQPPPPPPPEPGVIIKMEEPDTKACSDEQRRQLAIAFPAAKLMAEQARAAVSRTPDKVGPIVKLLLQRYFGNEALSHLPEIHAGFSKILSRWNGWDSRFNCVEQTEGSCPHKDPLKINLGYVMKKRRLLSPNEAYGTVYVCKKAFSSPHDMQRLSWVVLHELSHRLDNTDDKKYCEEKEGWCASLRTKEAIDNADSYARFARDIFNASM